MGPMPPVPPMPPVAFPPVAVPPVTVPPTVTPPILHATAGPVPGDVQETMHQTGNDACIKRLRQLNVDIAPKFYIAPNAPGTTGKQTEIQSNIFGVELEKDVTVYHYMVHAKADLASNKEAVFTKKGKEDFVVLDRHEKCCNIFFHAVETNKDFFRMDEGNRLIYDGQSILFTTIDLFPDQEKKDRIMEINGALTKNKDLESLPIIQLEVYASKIGSMQISSQVLASRTADSNIEANNRAYAQFLELAMNQNCIRETSRFGCFEHGKVYFIQPTESGFHSNDCIDVGDGKALLPGIKKTVQFIEGPFGRGQNNPSVVVDAMKAAFHKEQTVVTKIYEILRKDPSNGLTDFEREKAFQVMKGLDVFSTYTGRTRHLKIEGIHHDCPSKAKFELKDGTTQTVEQYLASKYQIQLKYPNANLLICKERGNKNFFPTELLFISKNQRVSIPQQTSVQSQKTTKECAVLPDVRQRLIVTGKNAIGLNEENSLLMDLGIKVYPQPLMINGREMDGKEINYSSGRAVRSEAGKWRAPATLHTPAAMPKVWAAYAVGTGSSQFNAHDMQTFVAQFVDTCNKRGMSVGPPAEFQLVSIDTIEEKLNFAIKSSCKFVFLITDDSITHLHPKIKLLERNSEMIIQDMKMSKALSVVRQAKRLTMENVINKTNVKLGGLNYTVTDSKKSMTEDQLIVGVGVSAPPPGTKFVMEGKGYLNPLIIGYASNAKSNHEFTGDFVLAPVGQDTMASIEDVLKNTLEMYQENRKSFPKRIIIYRSGAPDGAHAAIIAYEIPLARAIIQEFCPTTKMIYIVVTKDHSYRFFKDYISPGSRATEMNIPPGIVLDTCVTNPACKQFFLNSHSTLQGTAKTPLYTVLADDCNAGMDRLEELTYTLCYHHQIVALTTSLPTPLYVANEYAKRGRTLWTEKTHDAPEAAESNGSQHNRYKDLTTELAYKYTTTLGAKRINA
uniref:Piwi domain-containing protein n=1 Tax=Caenorhabditis japonica TaxID=281687 RepID=A0A8R1DJI3_CAEJA